MTAPHLTDEERDWVQNWRNHVNLESGVSWEAARKFVAIIDRLTAPAQEAPTDAEIAEIEKRHEAFSMSREPEGFDSMASAHADRATLLRALKSKRAWEREKIIQTHSEWRAYGKGDDPEELADALLSSGVVGRVPSEDALATEFWGTRVVIADYIDKPEQSGELSRGAAEDLARRALALMTDGAGK